ncbi:cytochrome c oxidase assembly protein [Rhodobaculum claviforme]|uniref:Cytochrome c oxidase assembly protein CtaG n=1 Tax=Rhodobaculum claviforme TaxID=1549854 RepID=A0A934TLZ9_9RHOB|nr:cytochrome c oxidase assembly protein [Rhodobaculum claviforme]MBK5927483.1 cytochrome c oxidase assembly protein [Rhodobaculum claviforme]
MSGTARTATAATSVALFMAGMGWAAVPLYDLFCRVTGYGGTTGVAAADSDRILEQTVRIRFDASRARDFPWEFRPMERTMEVRIGETALAFYEAYNPTDEPIAGVASYNVTPYAAGRYFMKIHCFCFEYQVLQPGERVQMPVSFYVDPDMVGDREARGVRQITLSYTFHPADMPAEEHASLGGAAAD